MYSFWHLISNHIWSCHKGYYPFIFIHAKRKLKWPTMS